MIKKIIFFHSHSACRVVKGALASSQPVFTQRYPLEKHAFHVTSCVSHLVHGRPNVDSDVDEGGWSVDEE